MPKLKLGNAPKNFPHVVHVPLIEGGTADVEMIFKYRTRLQFGELVDAIIKKANAPVEAKAVKGAKKTTEVAVPDNESAVAGTMTQLYEKGNVSNVEYILDIAEGWNLDDTFGMDALTQLANEQPGAIAAISEAYRIAITEGRTKN